MPHSLILDIVYLAVGIIILYCGAEGLVVGARHIALRVGLTPLVAGLTVVAIGTSMPEAAGSFIAQLTEGAGNVAVGNIIGSNIANVGLILGIAALVTPIPVSRLIRNREMPIMLGLIILFMLFMLPDILMRWEGITLVVLLVIYLWLQVWWWRRGLEAVRAEEAERLDRGVAYWVRDIAFVVLGIVGLIVGASFLVDGAVDLAGYFGISQRVIGLTVVAIGTSLPELATTVVAAYRGHADLALGNVVGSNILNILFVAGGVSAISPVSFTNRLLVIDAPVMLGFSLLLWLAMWVAKRIERWQGAILLALYICYATSIFLWS